MANNIILLKNFVSIFKSRLTNKEAIEEHEYISFLETLDSTFEYMNNELLELEKRIKSLETKKVMPKNQSDDSFVMMVLNRIVILKNIIKKKMDSPNEQMFSLNLTTVETIESEIQETRTVPKHALEKLNKIYLFETEGKRF